MGFSVSAGTAILLIAAFASVGMLYTTAYDGYEQLQDANALDRDGELDKINTEVVITNITHNDSHDPHIINITATNTGTTSLGVNDTDVLLNGSYTSIDASAISTNGETYATGPDGTELWQPHESLTLTIRKNVSDPIGVKIVTENGVSTMEVGP